jgi:hypothetical protein
MKHAIIDNVDIPEVRRFLKSKDSDDKVIATNNDAAKKRRRKRKLSPDAGAEQTKCVSSIQG